MDVVALVATTHRGALVTLCSALEGHYQGLAVAARAARKAGLVDARLARKLQALDQCFGVVRHITQQSSGRFLGELTASVRSARMQQSGPEQRRLWLRQRLDELKSKAAQEHAEINAGEDTNTTETKDAEYKTKEIASLSALSFPAKAVPYDFHKHAAHDAHHDEIHEDGGHVDAHGDAESVNKEDPGALQGVRGASEAKHESAAKENEEAEHKEEAAPGPTGCAGATSHPCGRLDGASSGSSSTAAKALSKADSVVIDLTCETETVQPPAAQQSLHSAKVAAADNAREEEAAAEKAEEDKAERQARYRRFLAQFAARHPENVVAVRAAAAAEKDEKDKAAAAAAAAAAKETAEKDLLEADRVKYGHLPLPQLPKEAQQRFCRYLENKLSLQRQASAECGPLAAGAAESCSHKHAAYDAHHGESNEDGGHGDAHGHHEA